MCFLRLSNMSLARPSLLVALTMVLGPWMLLAQNTSAVTANGRAGKLNLWQAKENWFYGQRTFPGRRLPHNARLNALRELDRMLASEAAATSNTSPSKLQWTQIGPMPSGFWNSISNGGSSGRVTALAVDPSNASVVYLGTAGGGVWKTTDGGLHWAPLTDTQASLTVGALALDPSNSSVLYVGTGEANSSVDSYYGAGILKSTDGGNTWANYPGPFVDSNGGGTSFGSLAVHPSNGSIVLAGTYSGIYRSTDAGVNWSSVLPGGTGYSVAFNASDGNIAYAAIGSIFGGPANGIYKSTDGGSTWRRLTGTGANVLPSSNLGRIRLVLDPSNASTLYVSISNCCAPFSAPIGVFKSTDAGANWVQLTTPPSCCDWYGNVLAVDPANPNVLLAGAGDLYRSLDGGQTWSNFSVPQASGISLHPDQHALGFSVAGDKLYVGNDGGAFSTLSPDSTYNWNDLNSTLATITFYPGLSIDVNNVKNGFGGTQDNGTLHYAGNLAWDWTTCGDGSYTAIDFVSSTNVYAYCPGPTIQKSTTGGVGGWFSVTTGIDTSDRFGWVAPLVMDPSNSQTLYVGSQRLYQTTNGASSWALISPDLTFGASSISTVAVAPGAPNVVYVGTYDGNVEVSTNAGLGIGATWTPHTAGLPQRSVSHISIDPSSPATAYLTMSGFGSGHVFKTTNGGTNWIDISGNLPNAPVNDLVIDSARKTLYVGTDVGVFVNKNGGKTWATFVNGLPRVVIDSLQLQQSTRTLRALSHGRSAWDVQLR